MRRPDPVQAQLVEPEADYKPDRFGSEAFPPPLPGEGVSDLPAAMLGPVDPESECSHQGLSGAMLDGQVVLGSRCDGCGGDGLGQPDGFCLRRYRVECDV